MMNLAARNGRRVWPSNTVAFDNLDHFIANAFDVPAWRANDVRELDDRAEITIDVPGVKREEISVTVEHRTLTVKVASETRGTWTRQYTIGAKYDLGQLSAKLDLGVLTLNMPKAVEAVARTVEVAVA